MKGSDRESASGVNVRARRPASVRQAQILDAARVDGFISVSQSASAFGVSEMTIRRDLTILGERGLLSRTHGGAMSNAERPLEVVDIDEPAFQQRRRRNAEAKSAMARAVAKLIEPGETIGLDVGTSTLALAEVLCARSDLRIVTSSLQAAVTLSASRNFTHMLGGTVRGPEPSVVGMRAVQELGNYNLDRVFIGVSGLIGDGLFDYSIEDSEVKQAFIACAAQVIVLCDSSKFDHRSLARVCDLSEVDMLVTDAEPPAHLTQLLSAAEVAVLVAPQTMR